MVVVDIIEDFVRPALEIQREVSHCQIILTIILAGGVEGAFIVGIKILTDFIEQVCARSVCFLSLCHYGHAGQHKKNNDNKMSVDRDHFHIISVYGRAKIIIFFEISLLSLMIFP